MPVQVRHGIAAAAIVLLLLGACLPGLHRLLDHQHEGVVATAPAGHAATWTEPCETCRLLAVGVCDAGPVVGSAATLSGAWLASVPLELVPTPYQQPPPDIHGISPRGPPMV